MSYSTTISGIPVTSNVPLSGHYAGHWQIDLNFRIPYLDYAGYLAALQLEGIVADFYKGPITNFSSKPYNDLIWRIQFDATSPEIIPLLEVIIPAIATVIAIALIADILVTITDNPTTAVAIPIIAIAVLLGAGAYLISKVKRRRKST